MNIDICFILEGTYPLTIGGISSWVDSLTRALPHLRFAVVRIGETDAQPEKWAFDPAPNLVSIDFVADDAQLNAGALARWAERSLAQVPRAPIYQAVGAGLAAVLARAAAKRHRQRWIMSEHASYLKELAMGAMTLESGRTIPCEAPTDRDQLLKLFASIAKQAYREADAVTALTAATRRDQLAAGASRRRSFVIANGVEVHDDAAAGGDAEGQPFTIGYVGRLHPIKGTDRLLKVAAQLRRKIPDLRVDVVGPWDADEHYRARCLQLAEPLGDSVRFRGAQPRGRWPMRPDCLVLPSRSEAQPLAALEAMARAVPVVASDVGDCRQLLSDGGAPAGTVVDSHDTAGFVHALAALANNPRRRRQWGANGRRRVRRRHSRATMASNFNSLYQALGARS